MEEEKYCASVTDVTGFLGECLEAGFDEDVPDEAVSLLKKAYDICVKSLENGANKVYGEDSVEILTEVAK